MEILSVHYAKAGYRNNDGTEGLRRRRRLVERLDRQERNDEMVMLFLKL
jgi:hypothetical protein